MLLCRLSALWLSCSLTPGDVNQKWRVYFLLNHLAFDISNFAAFLMLHCVVCRFCLLVASIIYIRSDDRLLSAEILVSGYREVRGLRRVRDSDDWNGGQTCW